MIRLSRRRLAQYDKREQEAEKTQHRNDDIACDFSVRTHPSFRKQRLGRAIDAFGERTEPRPKADKDCDHQATENVQQDDVGFLIGKHAVALQDDHERAHPHTGCDAGQDERVSIVCAAANLHNNVEMIFLSPVQRETVVPVDGGVDSQFDFRSMSRTLLFHEFDHAHCMAVSSTWTHVHRRDPADPMERIQ